MSLHFTPLNLKVHGTYAVLAFKSSKPVVPFVELALEAPSKKTARGFTFADDQPLVMSTPVIGSGGPIEGNVYHEVTLMPVNPNTKCWYVISIGDSSYPEAVYNYVGTFRTVHRRLDIEFEKIKMIDDSDDTGAGEFGFCFFVNDDCYPNNVALLYPPLGGEVSIDSGETEEPLNRRAHMWPYDANSVSLKVNALENDDDPWPEDTDYDNFFISPLDPNMGTGSSVEWEWLQGQKTVNVHKPGPTEDRTVPFTIDADGKDEVDMHYKVSGTVKVSHPFPEEITSFPSSIWGLGPFLAITTPTVTAVSPVNWAEGVGRGTNVKATFSEDVDPATVTTSTFTLVKSGSTQPISAKVTYDVASRTATLNPYGGSSTLLDKCKWYIATLTTGIKDKTRTPLAAEKVWVFRTSGC